MGFLVAGRVVAALVFIQRQVGLHVDGFVQKSVTFPGTQRACDFDHVIAAVAVVREAHADAAQFQITHPDADRQDVHLPAGIVDVVLALHAVAGGLLDVGQAGAIGRATAVAHMQRAVRVGRNEFDGHRFARAFRLMAEAFALFQRAAPLWRHRLSLM